MYQLLCKFMFLMFMLLVSELSYGMKIEPSAFEKMPLGIQCLLVNYFDNPLIFAKTTKQNCAMVKKVGEYNLVLLGEHQEPNFVESVVEHFLLSHYVPVVLINNSSPFEKESMDFFSLDAYKKSFYTDKDKKSFSSKVTQRDIKRLHEAIEQKKIQYGCYKIFCHSTHNDVLMRAVLFGSSEDMWRELKSKNCSSDTMLRAIKALISYAPQKNDTLETLLLMLKGNQLCALANALGNESGESEILRGLNSYKLLFLADRAKNKKAFELLSDIDPYVINKVLWRKHIGDNALKTTLVRIIEDGNFDPGNIEIFKKYGGIIEQKVIEGELPKFSILGLDMLKYIT